MFLNRQFCVLFIDFWPVNAADFVDLKVVVAAMVRTGA